MSAVEVQNALRKVADPVKAAFFPRFFKSGPGQYAEGDKFLGVTVPKQRLIAKKYYVQFTLDEAMKLLKSKWHEERLTGLFILVHKFQKGSQREKDQIVEVYMRAIGITGWKFADETWGPRKIPQGIFWGVNNWDLVDSSAPYIVGAWLLDKDRKILYRLAQSDTLWERRIAIISTLWFIRNNEFADTVAISELLLKDSHDLIHKAVGWALREMGKRAPDLLIHFLDQHAYHMPRTALRYAIEHYPAEKRHYYLNLKSGVQ